MEFFRKGKGVGFGTIHNFEAHFCASKAMEVLMKTEGYAITYALTYAINYAITYGYF